jgi:DNA-binding transcriptional ArsR family regulator
VSDEERGVTVSSDGLGRESPGGAATGSGNGGVAGEVAGRGLSTAAGSREVRTVADVDALKAMADPLRLAILAALMDPVAADLRVMSVKELAEELGEPQTKLYRHVKQLEAAGLIRVAASRLVSGILEQRYQASQRDIMLGPELLRDKALADEAEPLVAAVLDRYRSQFAAAHRAGLIPPGDYPPDQAYRRAMMIMTETRVSPARATAIRNKLQEIIDELGGAEAQEIDGVPINVLIGFHSASPTTSAPLATPGE